ncbi:hypothetical protein ACNOYE_18600 [Nannocystaceae bacterium ST9]
MKPRVAIVLALSLLGLACDARTTEEPEAEHAEREAQAGKDAGVTAAEPVAATPSRDLAELQRELANHETQLRELGVPIIAAALTDDAARAPAEETITSEALGEAKPTATGGSEGRSPAKAKKDRTAAGETKTKQAEGAAPGSAPRPFSPDPDATIADEATEKAEKSGKAEQAKSVQAPPSARPSVRAEERCPLICTLADSTCELGDEICELADRHVDDDTYSLACERATNDCKQAREACLECLG